MQMTPLSKDPSEYSAIVESITSISLKNRKNQQLSEKLSSRVLTLNSLIHDKMATEEMKRRKRLKPIIRLEPESAGFSD